MRAQRPLVSAVIPSCRRPELALRAVRSALAQTLQAIEVIVVPACPGDGLAAALEAIHDERLRVLEPKPLGASAARNRGIEAAQGLWAAFLDDDDEWLPEKLERQLSAANASAQPRPLISCRMLARGDNGDTVWPRRLPEPGEPLGDYLFRRRTLRGAGGFAQTSTLFVPLDLVREVRFDEELQIAEDLDWALRAEAAGSHVEFPGAEPLAVWNLDGGRERLSAADAAWRQAAAWANRSRHLLSPEAYASYLLTWVSYDAAREDGGWTAWRELARQARRNGRPSALDWLVHCGHFLLRRGAGR